MISRRATSTFVVLLAAVVGSFLAIRCDTGTTTSGSDVGQPVVSTVSTHSDSAVQVDYVDFNLSTQNMGVFGELFSRIPAEGTAIDILRFGDYESVRLIRDIELPDPTADADAGWQYFLQMVDIWEWMPESPTAGRGPWLSGFTDYAGGFDTYDYVGFDQRNVDHSIEVIDPETGDATLELMLGRYDSSATAEALSQCVECPQAESIQYRGTSYYVWQDGSVANLRLRLRPPLFDHLGRAGVVWVDDGSLARTFTTSEMEQLIDVTVDDRASLVDNQDYRLVGQALEALGALNGIVTRMSFSIDELAESSHGTAIWPTAGKVITELPPVINRDYALSAPLLKPFTLIGSARGYDGERSYTALAILHDDASVASENAVRLINRIKHGENAHGERWSDLIAFIEMDTADRLLLARLYPVQPGDVFIQSPIAFSTLAVHE